MKFVLLDMVWPAIYVSETFWHFWFLVGGTIIIELFVIKYFLKFSWKKSFVASFIGNCVSGFIGTFIMLWGMIFWHSLVDWLVPHGTFDIINWIATYILMCMGSVWLETLTIKLIYKEKIKRLFLPMLTGNLLSYIFIAFFMLTTSTNNPNKDPDEVRTEDIKYTSDKRKFILLDSSAMQIDSSLITISLDKNNQRLNDTKSKGYDLVIYFKKQYNDRFQFDFHMIDEEHSGGQYNNTKRLHIPGLKDEYRVILEQKNPDTAYGWTWPIHTDTLLFRRLTQ